MNRINLKGSYYEMGFHFGSVNLSEGVMYRAEGQPCNTEYVADKRLKEEN